MTRESTIEEYFVNRVKAVGGFSLKTDKVQGRRFLDRTAWLPGGVVLVAELKRPKNGRYQPHQPVLLEMLRAMGHNAVTLKTKGEIDAWFADYVSGRKTAATDG